MTAGMRKIERESDRTERICLQEADTESPGLATEGWRPDHPDSCRRPDCTLTRPLRALAVLWRTFADKGPHQGAGEIVIMARAVRDERRMVRGRCVRPGSRCRGRVRWQKYPCVL